MKQKVIETAGKAWRTLGEQGEINLDQFPRALKEDESLAYQALGWLAREDKINYTIKNSKTFVSLVASELSAFRNTFQNAKGTTAAKQSQSQISKKRFIL